MLKSEMVFDIFDRGLVFYVYQLYMIGLSPVITDIL